ncbi:MAG: hypothetical protein ACR2IB_02835 [Pyrinomonadaceae bacterium]
MTLENVARRDLIVSMGMLGFIIAVAVSQLAWEGNWQKALRVSLAFLTYSTVLLMLVHFLSKIAVESIRPPFWIFAVAGGAAEVASGWMRPDWNLSDTLMLPLAAAALIGGSHWLALTAWRPLRERILSGGTYVDLF